MRLEMMANTSDPLQEKINSEFLSAATDKAKIENVTLDDDRKNNAEMKKKVKKAVSDINEMNEPSRTNVQYAYHEKLEEYYVTVVDQKTDEVLKEIPPKKMLDIYASMAEFMGILVDEKA